MPDPSESPADNRPPSLQTIGWKEVVSFPDWGVQSLLAKADTGARGSAIDVASVRRLDADRVAFRIVLDRKDRSSGPEVTAQILRSSRVRSSNGEVQERFVVRTDILIGGARHAVDFSLVNRRRMICRVLLGRRALAGRFVVDSDEKYVHGPRRKPSAHPQSKKRK